MTRALLILGALTAAACARTFPSTEMVAVRPAQAAMSCAADADCGASQLCVDRACFDIASASAMACAEMPVHFATASAVIDRNNRAELNQAAICLRNHRDVHVTIAGNADERGAGDFNRDLAQRRADAVAGYLEAAGVAPGQLSTVTYGSDQPLCAEHDDECWRQNRRVELKAPNFRADVGKPAKNKLTTDDNAKGEQRIDSTGNGTDNGSPVGK